MHAYNQLLTKTSNTASCTCKLLKPGSRSAVPSSCLFHCTSPAFVVGCLVYYIFCEILQTRTSSRAAVGKPRGTPCNYRTQVMFCFSSVWDFFLRFHFVCESNISGTAEWICAKFTGKTCFVERSRSPGTKPEKLLRPAPQIRSTILALYKLVCIYVCMYVCIPIDSLL